MPERNTRYAIRNTKAYAVILVGGKGKRLRPLSTDERPKAFLSVTKDRRSMFKNTLRRIRRLVPSSRIIVVANKMHERLVRRDFPRIGSGNLILEPVSRNTAPAVGVAASVIARRDRDAIMAVLPTDHYITNEERQIEAMSAAFSFLRKNRDSIVVFGIKPTFPSTEFGYIKVSRPDGGALAGAVKVKAFVEKPDIVTARDYLKRGDYFWNSGAFCFAAGTILRAMKSHAPAIYRNLKYAKVVMKRYEKMPDISLDYAVMEKAGRIYCIRGSYGWNDVGSFEALKEVLKKESRRFVEEDGKIVRIL